MIELSVVPLPKLLTVESSTVNLVTYNGLLFSFHVKVTEVISTAVHVDTTVEGETANVAVEIIPL